MTIVLFSMWLSGALVLTAWLVLLLVLAGLSPSFLRAAREAPARGAAMRRLAVLVPAHDEELLAAGTVRSVLDCDYPEQARRVFVVADNCSDETAERARAAGAVVFERRDPANRGKGYALDFGLRRIAATWEYDAVVVLDADARVAPSFLQRLNARLEAGERVIQARYETADPERSWLTRITHLTIGLRNFRLYPGMAGLGISIPLRGSGMCLVRDIVARSGWPCHSLTEDLEFSLRLVEAGETIRYEPYCVVRQYMPPTLSAAAQQRTRWSAGESLLGAKRRALLRESALKGDWRRFVFALVLAAPPISLLTLASVLLAGLGGLLRARTGFWTPALMGGGLVLLHVGYFMLGLTVVDRPREYLRALARAPGFACWRVAIFLRASLPWGRPRQWVRTERILDDAPGGRQIMADTDKDSF